MGGERCGHLHSTGEVRGEGRGGEGPVLNREDLASYHHRRQIAPETTHHGSASLSAHQ